MVANRSLKAIGVSGDGDTASIGLGQFLHFLRRNVPMVYIVENNGVYGLTKGQFSATADKGQVIKKIGENPFLPIDICQMGLNMSCGFVARSFAGDPKQVKELIKAALSLRRDGPARHHQPVRHLQQPGRVDQELHLGQGTRGAAARCHARAAAGGDPGRLRRRPGDDSRAARRIDP